ncbi:hypothetical protein M758_6G017400 [Ceratodon purpureus]|nr:hypothetical protein M758_6G017400 [Ceratodon purpureus]
MAAAFAARSPLLGASTVALSGSSSVSGRARFESVCVRAAGPGSAQSAVDLEVPPVEEEEEWYEVPVHKVTVKDRQKGVTHSFFVPEDQYILQTGEEQKIELPFSCRHGCCTACAVRVKSGQLYQPQALGISAELREKGYGLLCVGYPLSDIEVETQDEDEVYWLQFGQYFARNAIERDDFALELALADE